MKRPAVVKVTPKRAPVPDLVETFDCEQRSDRWYALRLGLMTASNFGKIMADSEEQKGRTKLLYQLAGELFSGQPADTYSNAAMERGREMEAAALEHFEFMNQVEVQRVGFVKRTILNPLGEDLVVGCSPDGLVGDDALVQVKTMQPDLLAQLVDSGRFPSEHRAQCQCELWVTGRSVCHLKVFYKGMSLSPIYKIQRDEAYIARMKDAAEKFAFDLRNLVKRLEAKGGVRKVT